MTFRVALGLAEGPLNRLAAAVYAATRSTLFAGPVAGTVMNEPVTGTWSAGAAPGLDLSPSAAGGTAFTLALPAVSITLAFRSASYTIGLDLLATCQLVGAGPTLAARVETVAPTAASEPTDPVQKALVDDVVVPALTPVLAQLVSGLTLPVLQIGAVALSDATPWIEGEHLMALCNLAVEPAPAQPQPGFAWPPADFYALLDAAVLTELGRGAIERPIDVSHLDQRLDLTVALHGPLTLTGTTVGGQVALSGTARAKVPDVGGCHFDVKTKPDALAIAGRLSVQDSAIAFVLDDISTPFTIDLHGHSTLCKLASTVIDALASLVKVSIGKAFSGEALGRVGLPSWPFSIAGYQTALRPTEPTLGNVAGWLALSGGVTI